MKFRLSVVLLSVFILTAGCKNFGKMKFDKAKWHEQPELGFTPPYRHKMLNDLIENYKLKGLKHNEVINLLGQPNSHDSSSFSYDIIIDYGSDIDPIYVKDLVFNFSKDSFITDFRVEESQN